MLNSNMYISVLDFFVDPVVYRTSDAWGDILVVEHGDYRNLTFGTPYDQSHMDVKNPDILIHEYTRAMMLVLAFIKPRHVTMLGLGGGCLLRSLSHILPKCELHAVELRQRVYEVCVKFFGIPASNKITITIADAEQRLKVTDDASTDIIFADMYHAHSVNPFQTQEYFLNQCYRILSDNGWLVVNYHDISDLNIDFFKHLYDLFSDVLVCPIPGGNNVLFASKYRIDKLHDFDVAVTALEKKLEIDISHLFKRLTRLRGA